VPTAPRVRKARRRSIRRELQSISRSLASVSRAFARLGPVLEAMARGTNPALVPRPRNLSPQRRAELKLQGSYIGHVRKLKLRQRARVKKLREDKGVRAAIRLAKALSRK
jgi:hypothetical protein